VRELPGSEELRCRHKRCIRSWTNPERFANGSRPVVTFFERSHVVQDWSDSPAGWKAAARMIGSGLESERTVPIGKVLTNYTVERITFHSEQTVNGGGIGPRGVRPLCTRCRVAVVAWTAIVKNGDENA
jgi:hypothetical protein